MTDIPTPEAPKRLWVHRSGPEWKYHAEPTPGEARGYAREIGYVRSDLYNALAARVESEGKVADAWIGEAARANARAAALAARVAELERELQSFREERSFVVGWNDGFEEGVKQAEGVAREHAKTWGLAHSSPAVVIADAIAALLPPAGDAGEEGEPRNG